MTTRSHGRSDRSQKQQPDPLNGWSGSILNRPSRHCDSARDPHGSLGSVTRRTAKASTVAGKTILVGAAIALVSAGVAAGAVYSVQRGRVEDKENRLQRALDAAQKANEEVEALGKEVGDLEARAKRLRTRWREAQEATRLMQDCVGRVSDEERAGPKRVIFGYPSLSDAPRDELTVDVAEWYFGEDAHAEALEDGELEAAELDYYIRNDDPAQIPMPVADDIVVVTTMADRHNIPAPKCKTWTAFVRTFRHPQPWQTSITNSPYWMTIEDGLLVRMVEQYRP